MSEAVGVETLDDYLDRYKPSWLWRRTPFVGRCAWHGLEYLFQGDLREAWSNVHQIKDHLMWYIRASYAPYNRMKVRNVQRRYSCDDDDYLFHAMFSVLCKHVERSHGGADEFRKDIAERRAWSQSDVTAEHDDAWNKAYDTMLSLYEWYVGTNWDDPIGFPKNGTKAEQMAWADTDAHFHDVIAKEKARQLLEVRGFMWT
jgi:hypothetical protein